MSQTYTFCLMEEIPEGEARGFSIKQGSMSLGIFVVKKNGRLYGYRNNCPHTGVNLDWQPDQFHDHTGKLLQCATHGALFEIESGLCIDGPCYGQSLTPVKIRLDNKVVKIILENGESPG